MDAATDLLLKETTCVSAATYATARARTAKILQNIFVVMEFVEEVVSGPAPTEHARLLYLSASETLGIWGWYSPTNDWGPKS